MRVTNALITRTTIDRLQQNQRRMAEAHERVTSGQRVSRMSDDPTAGSTIMQASGSLRAIEQFRRNADVLGTRLSVEDTTLDAVTQILSRAKEIGVGAASATSNAATRLAAAAEVKELLAEAIQLGNTKFGDDYLFGGSSSSTVAPFDAAQTAQTPRFVRLDGAAVPVVPQGARTAEIASGQTMPGSHDGDTVFLQTGVLDALYAMQTALEADDPDAIAASIGDIDDSIDDVQTLVGEVGARQNHAELIAAGLDALQLTLEGQRSDLGEIDMEKAITEMLSRQSAYQAAMMASSKVMGMSLTDYLR